MKIQIDIECPNCKNKLMQEEWGVYGRWNLPQWRLTCSDKDCSYEKIVDSDTLGLSQKFGKVRDVR